LFDQAYVCYVYVMYSLATSTVNPNKAWGTQSLRGGQPEKMLARQSGWCRKRIQRQSSDLAAQTRSAAAVAFCNCFVIGAAVNLSQVLISSIPPLSESRVKGLRASSSVRPSQHRLEHVNKKSGISRGPLHVTGNPCILAKASRFQDHVKKNPPIFSSAGRPKKMLARPVGRVDVARKYITHTHNQLCTIILFVVVVQYFYCNCIMSGSGAGVSI